VTVAPLVQARGITKRFGRVVALQDASLTARAGQVTCLLGDNGAGKTTLIKVLAGVYAPTAGTYLLAGAEVRFGSPREALAQGIATVYQDLAMVPLMSVWRNFFLGSELTLGRGPLRRLDVARCRRVALEELAAMGVELRDPEQPVESLSGGERQAVAIARAVHFGARVLILDEPTAALGVRQSEHVLDLVRRSAARGVAVVLVTHNPHHAHPVGDRFAVLRRGQIVADRPQAEITQDELTRLMGGESSTSSRREGTVSASPED
jgi:simple sugar transport system ATP-binding protein